jgi:hypothetical protein
MQMRCILPHMDPKGRVNNTWEIGDVGVMQKGQFPEKF